MSRGHNELAVTYIFSLIHCEDMKHPVVLTGVKKDALYSAIKIPDLYYVVGGYP